MYETFFGLERRPFLAVPDTDLFFSTVSMTENRQTVERIVRRGEGISLVVGESGTGKTLLLRMLRKVLDAEYTVSLLFNGRLETPKAFLQQILFDLRLPFANADETELRLALWDFARQDSTPGFVLLLDDAQYLSTPVFEEIRLLLNCDDGAVPFFRVVLAGTTDLEEKLTHPSLDAFNQRIVSRSYLDMLTREETANYVAWQTNVTRRREKGYDLAGLGALRRLDGPHGVQSESIFTDGAKRLIYQLTDGLPRLINQLCDTALMLAAERTSRSIDEPLLQTAWTLLQQIPEDPHATPPNIDDLLPDDDQSAESLDEQIARKKSIFVLKEFDASVEFGSLDDPEPTANVHENEEETEDVEKIPPFEEPIDIHALQVASEPVASDYDVAVAGTIGPEDFPADESTVVVRRFIPYPVRKRRIESDVPRKYRKHRLRCSRLQAASLSLTGRTFEAFDSWVGCLTTRILYQPVHLSLTPLIDNFPIEETAPMDQETLEQYGREVLEDRPPFVRKEPHYAYQTTSETPLTSYPHPFYDLPLCWAAPQSRGEAGYAIAYSEFMHREDAELESEVELPVAEIADSPIIRLALHPCRPMTVSAATSFDELFEVWETVDKRAGFAEEHRRFQTSLPQRTLPDDDELTKKIEAVVYRITQAAEKIERAADVSENAGLLVRRAAEFVDTEVHAALPTYKELFQELSEFQRTITEEVAVLRMKRESSIDGVLLFPVPPSKEAKPPRLGSPQAQFEFSNIETEHRIDAKILFQ